MLCGNGDIEAGSVKNVIMLLDNHVKCGIEIDISSYEKPMRFRLVRPGSNWYTAGRTVECILM